MYASALLTILLASATLAVPNILPRPHAIPPAPRNRDGIAYPSAAYGLTPESTSTTALTLSTTIHTPRATVTWPATIIRATETVNQTAARTRAEIRSSLEAGTKSLTSTDSSTSTNLPEPPTLAGVSTIFPPLYFIVSKAAATNACLITTTDRVTLAGTALGLHLL